MKRTHYSLAFKHDALERWAADAAAKLFVLIGDRVPVFCYSGYSGITHGQALARAWRKKHADFGEAYVRKEDEKSHGREVEWGFSTDDAQDAHHVVVFVDDFVSSGRTRQWAIHQIEKNMLWLRCEIREFFNVVTEAPWHAIVYKGIDGLMEWI